MKKNIFAIIEARTGSKRFPNKVLKKIFDETLLEILIKRLKKSSLIKQIIIATTTGKNDLKIVNLAKKLKVKAYRGSEKDVLDRITKASIKYKAHIIVQLTGDNPFIDYSLVDKMISVFKRNISLKFLTNHGFGNEKIRTYPIGTDIKIFYKKDLVSINKLKLNKIYREHPSLFFYKNNSNLFKIKNIALSKKLSRKYKLRLTVDTHADYKFVKEIYKNLSNSKPYFNLRDIISLIDKNKKLLLINNKIKQKKVNLIL